MSSSYENSYKPENEVCPALGYQDVTVGVPVEIRPFARVGKIKTECIGKPVIDRNGRICEGNPKEICRFTVCQKIRVEVPVIFGAKTEVGEARINCKHGGFPCGASSEEKEHIEEEVVFKGLIG